jgi:TetR/AcrR family transcriptional regulator, mexCD-oprJ operon repressor
MTISDQSPSPLLERRRDELLAAATEVLVAEPGAPLSKVALAAGVSRTTLHARFPTRDDLLREVAKRALEVCERRVDDARSGADAPDGGLARTVDALVEIGPQLAFLWRNPSFDHDADLGERWRRIERELATVIAQAERAGAIRGGRPTWWDVYALLALVYVASENVYLGRLAPLDAPGLVLSTLEGGAHA